MLSFASLSGLSNSQGGTLARVLLTLKDYVMIVFDLDPTLIDSSHRAITRADGSLCLDSWRALSTRQYIMRDSLLPLAHVARDLITDSHRVAFCTARVMGEADHDFLVFHRLTPRLILSRPEGDHSSDGPLKVRLLREAGVLPSIFYDDNAQVREAIKRNFPGCVVACPLSYNQMMAA